MFRQSRDNTVRTEPEESGRDAEEPVSTAAAKRRHGLKAVESRPKVASPSSAPSIPKAEVSSEILAGESAEAAPEPLEIVPEKPVIEESPPAAEAPNPESPKDAEFAAAPKRRFRKFVLMAVGIAALAAGAWYGNYWWSTGRFIVTTDDAYVGAYTSTIAAKVSGYVVAVNVEDNAHVKAGDVIAKVDPGDYELAVENAKDNIATEQATIARIGKQIAAQQAAVEQAKAQLSSANAAQTRMELELTRQQELARHQYASHQQLEIAQEDRDQAVASVESAEAGIDSAETNVDVLKAQQSEAAAALKQLQTTLAKAERDLSFATIRAPFDGVIGNRAVQVGDYVDAGHRLATLVPLDAVYIDANFKETQLDRLRAGQHVAITVDALPGRSFDGTVTSVAPASGSVFSLLPPDNATGNFTKIVQRVAVRIKVPLSVTSQELLRPGMSVIVHVHTKDQLQQTAAAEDVKAAKGVPAQASGSRQ